MNLNLPLDDDDKDALIRCWELVKKLWPSEIVEDEFILKNCKEILVSFLGASVKWRITNLIHIQQRFYSLYVAHMEVDLGYVNSHKYGFKDKGYEYRLWCIGEKFPMSDFTIQEKQTTPSILSKFLSVFFRKQDLLIENSTFSKKYDVTAANIQDTRQFLRSQLVNRICNVDGFSLVVKNRTMILGIDKNFTLHQGIGILNIIAEI